jgi:hypothetical protein
MSKNRRQRPVRSSRSKNRRRWSSSAQKRFASSVAMWFGTMSRISPSPAARAACASESNSRSPPSASEKRVGSTTS